MRITGKIIDPVDQLTADPYRSLRGQKEICAGCQGTGEGDQGLCPSCAGAGRSPVNQDGGGLAHKAGLVDRLGSLLVVAVSSRDVPGGVRRELGRVTGTRAAGWGPGYYRHSPELMRLLRDYQIPYRTASYTHPEYSRARKICRKASPRR